MTTYGRQFADFPATELPLQFDCMGKQLAPYNTRLFAEGVMPQLHDLLDDEWEDRW